MEILLIVGSEMGNAEMVGDVVKDALEDQGHAVEMLTDPSLEEIDLDEREVLLVVTSTTGLGDVPQNLEPFYDELKESSPDMGHIRYGIVGMGDRNYKDTYCGGPRKMDAILQELGAQRVTEPLLLDATDHPMPDEDAVEWLPTFLAALD